MNTKVPKRMERCYLREAQLLRQLADLLLVVRKQVGVLEHHRHALDALFPHRLRHTRICTLFTTPFLGDARDDDLPESSRAVLGWERHRLPEQATAGGTQDLAACRMQPAACF